MSHVMRAVISSISGVVVGLVILVVVTGWQTPVFPPRPRLVTLTRIEVEPINDVGIIRAVNFRTDEGERFTVIGPANGSVLSWLVTQGTGAAVMITLVQP